MTYEECQARDYIAKQSVHLLRAEKMYRLPICRSSSRVSELWTTKAQLVTEALALFWRRTV